MNQTNSKKSDKEKTITSTQSQPPAAIRKDRSQSKDRTTPSGRGKKDKRDELDRIAAAAEAANNPPEPTSGSGQFEFPNGAIYEGEWSLFEEGGKKRHGFGKFICNGELYEGEWKQGQITGKGRYTFASGASYEGEFLNGKFHGRGTYAWNNGNQYIGDWQDNKMHGVGAFLSVSGDRYQGMFHNDRFLNAQGHWIAPINENPIQHAHQNHHQLAFVKSK